MEPNNTPQLNPLVAHILKAIALTENGGKIDIKNPKAGQSGEMKSLFQYTPGTWKGYSREITGQELPMTPANESAVTYGKVSQWVQQGYSPEEIASIWNSGRPDAYLQNKRGVNKYGVRYDVAGYVNKFKKYFDQSSRGENSPTAESKTPMVSMDVPQSTRPPVQGMLPRLAQQQVNSKPTPLMKQPKSVS